MIECTTAVAVSGLGIGVISGKDTLLIVAVYVGRGVCVGLEVGVIAGFIVRLGMIDSLRINVGLPVAGRS